MNLKLEIAKILFPESKHPEFYEDDERVEKIIKLFGRMR